jgi:hypothetical protein
MKHTAVIAVVTAFLLASTHALAAATYTECPAATPVNVFIGYDPPSTTSYAWVSFDNGQIAVIADTAPFYKAALAAVLTAKTTGQKLTVRYTCVSIACPGTNAYSVQGVWLN